jgi:hypothetical protein
LKRSVLLVEEHRSVFAQAAAEIRHAWRDLSGGLRATGKAIGSEGRAILGGFDAPEIERPGIVRRGWRQFRRTPMALQVVVAAVIFVAWTILVAVVVTAKPPRQHTPRPTRPGLVSFAPTAADRLS